jgi:hypothetical protein
MGVMNVDWENFEDQVFKHVKWELESGHLGLLPSRSRVQRNASYPSERRKAQIKIEVSIENFREGATEPSQIWLWECKNKGTRNVEVSDVEVLSSKIEQLGASRFRGSIVTTQGFQPSAVELAKSVGISLLVLKKELSWICKYSRTTPDEEREVIYVTDGLDPFGKPLTSRYLLRDFLGKILRAMASIQK